MAEHSSSGTNENIFNPGCSNGNINAQDVAIGSSVNAALSDAAVNINSNGSLREANSNVTLSRADVGEELRTLYRNMELPLVSWLKSEDLPLEHYSVSLQLTSSRLSRGTTDENYNLENIFDCDDDDRVSRILIESQAGYGKTTLIHKIVDDWVRKDDYTHPFECVVMIILKHLKGRTIKEAVLDEINLKEQVWESVNSGKTLLLLDGLDEVSEGDRENVLQTLCDSVGCKMTIVVTCRVGLFKREDEEIDRLLGGAAKNETFWDKSFTILGFNDDKRKLILEIYVQKEKKDEFMKIIQGFQKPAEELFESPLMMLFLANTLRENLKYDIKTKTDLFKNLIDCIIKVSVNVKNVVKLENNCTLFDPKTSGDYHDLLCKFGEISIGHVLSENLHFECDEFINSIYDIGFLIKHESKSKLETHTHYQCFHSTILEFAAAFALWNQFNRNGKKFSIETVNKINEISLKLGGTSMVIPFLCGLMETDVVKFFIQFTDYCALYSTTQHLMEIILSECTLSDELYGVVSKFIPPMYSCDNPQAVILTNLNFAQNIVSMMISSRELWIVAQERNIHVKSLFVYFTQDFSVEVITDQFLTNDVKCDNLFVVTFGEHKTYENVAMQFKLVLQCVSANFKTMNIMSSIRVDTLSKCVDSGIFNNHTIDYLDYELPMDYDIDATVRESVGKVIENINFKQLKLRVTRGLNVHSLNNIISTSANSSSITSLHIVNTSGNTVKLDLSTIVKNEEKCWDYLGIPDIEVMCTVPKIKNDCIKSVTISGTVASNCLDALFSLKLTELRCSIGLFRSILLLPNFSSWVGFESIVNLVLTLDGQTALTDISPCWDKFRNLEFVMLYFNDTGELQSEFVNHLDVLKTTRLQLHWEYSSDHSLVFCNVVRGIQNLVETNKLQLVKTINFEIEDCNEHKLQLTEFNSVVESIISAVKFDSKITATFTFQLSIESQIKLRQLFNSIDFSNLNVNEIIGESGSYYGKNFVFDCFYPFCHVLELQRKNFA